MPAALRIAVLEDHDDLRELTVAALRQQGYRVFGAYDAEELTDALTTCEIDLLLLDLNLPGEDGLSVARRFKAAMPRLYIIMTTARSRIEDRITGYDTGADIYLAKPLSEGELIAAVANIARRIERETGVGASLTLNLRNRQLTGAHSVPLSPSETLLLKVLVQAPDHRAETWRLLEATGREVDAPAKASLEVQMVILRKKIAAAGYGDTAIRAIRNGGYQLLCLIEMK
jgi:two-component system phosphate regulon response regulator OmpR